jgi:hypothetical protein
MRLMGLMLALMIGAAGGQSIESGTVSGKVTDPSGAVIVGAHVELRHLITGYQQQQSTDKTGSFRFNNIPPNNYQLTVKDPGFAPLTQSVEVRNAIPITVNSALQLAGETTSVNVSASAALVEADPSAHQDVDRSALMKLPDYDPAGQLSQAITYSAGGVAADANGFFHPLGDHGQTTIVIDGQPISDQQSKTFSTQIPTNALQGMELISGSPDAQYGDKSSLVVNTTTRSGLGAGKAFGGMQGLWSSFGSWAGSAEVGFGNARFGNFLAVNGIRSGRFLDTPEVLPIHAIGNNESVFDRLDWQPTAKDTLHLNLFTARNWFQAPNSYDQLSQDQRQRVLTWNVAPAWQRTLSPNALLTINAYARRDEVDYYPSRNRLNDTPVTTGQTRFLTNYGGRADLSVVRGHHDIKIGTQIQQTRLLEKFNFAVTDPFYNPVCLDTGGSALWLPGVTNPDQCAGVNPGYMPNPELQPGIVPYDITRGGTLFRFDGKHNVNQYAFYISDSIKAGPLTINLGLRDDQYNGLVSANGVQPRLGLSYLLPKWHTAIRASYARTFETPYNENLILSSGTGPGGLAENVFGSDSVPIRPGNRNQFNAGIQQALGRWLVLDGDAFWKYTHNSYDFSIFFNTPIAFPIAWHNSKLDGYTVRLSTVNIHGLQAYLTLGHTRARYFPPENGGLIPLGGFPEEVFRIDHDQEYQQNVVVRYQRPKAAEWISFVWRYDSGMVVSGVPDTSATLTLTAAQQVAIGLSCDGMPATYSSAITSCGGVIQSTQLTLPSPEAANPDHNPARVRPRNLFNISAGTDNLFHAEKGPRITLHFSVDNLTNKTALYNFLSTFSGTHFVAPRTYQVAMGFTF